MQTVSLREFSQFVPVCGELDSVQTAIDAFCETGCSHLVLIDEAQHPLGTLERGSLLLRLWATGDDCRDTLSDRPVAAVPSLPLSPTMTLQAAIAQHPLLLKPIVTAPSGWTLTDLEPYLSTLQDHHWILVDTTGKFIGLLDHVSVLQFMATHMRPITAYRHEPWVTQQTLSMLLQVIEQLPFPATLQTECGHVIAQNANWQQQIVANYAALSERAIATLLNTPLPTPPSDISSTPVSASSMAIEYPFSGSIPQSDQRRLAVDDTNTNVTSEPLCQLDDHPNRCTCVYPMPNGADQIWQFFSIPLQANPSLTTLAWSRLLDTRVPLSTLLRHHCPVPNDPPHPAPLQPWTGLRLPNTLWLILAQQKQEPDPTVRELTAKNADLTQLNRLKDEFLASISHELKTPLTAVLGLSNLLKNQQLGPLNERQIRYAQLIHQSGRHLVLIVNDILDLTRIETGQLELSPELLNLDIVCHQAYEQAQQMLIAEQQLTMQPDVDAAPLPSAFQLTIQPNLTTITADDMRLRQMLANLLCNAIKFTPPDGKLGLTVELWERWIAFTVWDTGIGIPPEKQPLIFQQTLKSADTTAGRRFEGTGLGLVLTQKLAQMHGGDVTFTSVAGEGSEFTLLLPPSPPEQSALQPSPYASPGAVLSRRLAIVVESVVRDLETRREQLERLGYRVAIARSGPEALEKIRRLRPAIVFMNPVLPQLSGWDVLTLIKAETSVRSIPIVITVSPIDQDYALKSGADGVLSRPITTQQISATIDRLVKPALPHRFTQPSSLTILYLAISQPESEFTEQFPLVPLDFNALLHPYHCRLVEVDDLDQAELLARVWQPDVLLLNGAVSEPLVFLQALKQSASLAMLPLVTLTPELTEAAHLNGLTVFPCLEPSPSVVNELTDPPALLQVLQIATGQNWLPTLLVADLSLLTLRGDEGLHGSDDQECRLTTQHWLRTFAQYLHTVGFRCYVRELWSEVLPLLHDQRVDALVLPWHPMQPTPLLLSNLKTLAKAAQRIPIVVWDCSAEAGTLEQAPFAAYLRAIATQVLPASLSIEDLVEQLRQIISDRTTDSL